MFQAKIYLPVDLPVLCTADYSVPPLFFTGTYSQIWKYMQRAPERGRHVVIRTKRGKLKVAESQTFLKWAMSWENLFMPYANNKGADQPAHPRSLISAIVVRYLDSIIPLVCKSEISSLYLASVAAQAGLCLIWSQTPKTGFLVTRLKCVWSCFFLTYSFMIQKEAIKYVWNSQNVFFSI